jgi:hypothetical protein
MPFSTPPVVKMDNAPEIKKTKGKKSKQDQTKLTEESSLETAASLPEQVGQVFSNDFTLPDQTKPIIPTPPDTKPEKNDTKPEVKKSRMKRWPENASELLSYNEIISPIKDILNKGYNLLRKNHITSFDYEGYNIGKHELQNHPSPKARLSEEALAIEKKFGHNLIDVVLNITFLLGVEQGRRAERRDGQPVEEALAALETYRKRNKDQRIRIDELEVILELKETHPNITDTEFRDIFRDRMILRRAKRIEEIKSDLKLDPTRNIFQFRTPARSKFKDLEKIASTLTKETCSEEQWKELLKERGWDYDEWVRRCKKKVRTFFA